MRRLGFEETDIQELVTLITRNPQLKVVSIFTHLAASGQPLHDTFTYQQIDLFNQIYQQIAQTLGYQPLKHVLNSDGIARFPQFQFDMVRLGIGLYGVTDVATVQTKLRYVSTLKTTIAQIKHLNKDETIGYNRAGNASHENTIIGTIRIGYADGYARQLGNGKAEVLVRNVRVPTIGNICMDMTMIDLSSVPDAQEGDEVILFGQNITVTELAQKLNTIPYEIFTMVSERVSRQVILD
jgi:alanine racemase